MRPRRSIRPASSNQVDLALGWAHRLIGLRNGKKVLDRPAVGMTRDEVMSIYQRVDPSGEPTAANRKR